MISDGKVNRLGESVSLYFDDVQGNTIIGISQGIVTLTRTGEQNYTLVLEENNPHPLEIRTQYGTITALLMPHKVLFKDNGEQIKVFLKYEILAGEIPVISNTVRIKCIVGEEEV